ncbi:hypothetical protein M0L20_00100 [Spirosoma sp. RP8]|uniref:PH domain-containing protein n=1 Tax=Spirosoma liriopis TaxID=2937440 RepID=A0ABT0HDJ2_9BACT|nr:hypothetical protein [Spirosoma liriopis]MCK8490226.1 hypothetical protein [Spirosoma liriopis]
MNAFSERQYFRQWWLWLILGFSGCSVVYGVIQHPGQWPGLVIFALVVALFALWRLDTRYDETGIHYRVWPLMAWRTIRWNDVQEATLVTYRFVGYGIRWNFGEWVYNVAGNNGLRIRTTTNKRVLIGTQQPDELQNFLGTLTVLH